MKQKQQIVCIVILFIIVTFIVLFFFNESDSIYGNYGNLYITEVCATNFSTIKDEDNDYSDYIEIYNGYNFDINLEGYHLSDKEFNTSKWTFPNITIKSGEYLVVFASGKSKNDKYVHTNFRLKETGEIVTLTDSENTILSKVAFRKTGYNTSYGYTGRKYVYYYSPSPGEKNSGKSSSNPIVFKEDNITLKINEYITENTMVYDSKGDYNPMVEIYNYGKKDIDLKGFFVSDSKTNLSKYVLPAVTIKKNDYLVIYLSNKDGFIDNEMHTNFKIKSSEVFNITSSHGKLIDQVNIIDLPINTSYGLNTKDEWCYYPTSTFGFKNSTKCFTKLGDNSE